MVVADRGERGACLILIDERERAPEDDRLRKDQRASDAPAEGAHYGRTSEGRKQHVVADLGREQK